MMESMRSLLTSESIIQKMEKVYNSNLNESTARRDIHTKFKDTQFDIEHCLFRPSPKGNKTVKNAEEYKVNSRGKNIFSKSWLPLYRPKAVICYCHNYGSTCTFLFQGIAIKLVASGYGVFALDYPGFGLSDGLHGYIPNFDELVDDVIEHFDQIRDKEDYKNLPKFLFGQSMGAVVALKIHLKQPNEWNGAILVSPVLKVRRNLIPERTMRKTLLAISRYCPRLRLISVGDLTDLDCRDFEKQRVARCNILAYKGRLHVKTAVEMFEAIKQIRHRFKDVSTPLLIMQGDADKVADPSGTKKLYEKAKTDDKNLKTYEKACHSILEGEPDHVISQALHDIIYWLNNRCIKTT